MAAAETERLARVIARSGRASRREAERIVEDGRVTVNGETVHHPAHAVHPKDDIRLDGKRLPRAPPRTVLILYKPRGTVTVRDDPNGRPSALDLVDGSVRLEAVGRLDFDTEGALLVTNDGDLKNKLTRPSAVVPRRYLVKVWKTPDESALDRLRNGVMIESAPGARERSPPCKARVIEGTATGNAWVEVTVTEGKDITVKAMFASIGHPVSKLRRESFATISLRGLARGEVRALTGVELARVEDIADGVDAQNAGKRSRYKKGYARPKAKKRPPGAKRPAGSKRLSGKKRPSGKKPAGTKAARTKATGAKTGRVAKKRR
jgi:23S rRNA pseudouridine2605 synthase